MRALTDTEKSILIMLQQGFHLKRNSKIPVYHIRYVALHLVNIRKAYNVHSTRELIVLASDPDLSSASQAVRLSPRGRQVLELSMRGFTYNQIAEDLGISRSGVRRHQEKMLWQNECKSMLELISKYSSWTNINCGDSPLE